MEKQHLSFFFFFFFEGGGGLGVDSGLSLIILSWHQDYSQESRGCFFVHTKVVDFVSILPFSVFDNF